MQEEGVQKVISQARDVASNLWRVESISVTDGVFILYLGGWWWKGREAYFVAGPEHPDIEKVCSLKEGDEVAFEFDEDYHQHHYLRIK